MARKQRTTKKQSGWRHSCNPNPMRIRSRLMVSSLLSNFLITCGAQCRKPNYQQISWTESSNSMSVLDSLASFPSSLFSSSPCSESMTSPLEGLYTYFHVSVNRFRWLDKWESSRRQNHSLPPTYNASEGSWTPGNNTEEERPRSNRSLSPFQCPVPRSTARTSML